MGRWTLVAGVVALLAAGLVWWQTSESRLPVVEVAETKRAAITASFTADGTVKGKSVDLASLATGRVQTLAAVEGQRVRAGQLLVQVDDRELAAAVREAEAAARSAQALVMQAEAARALTEQLTSARESAARARLAAAQALLEQVEAGARPLEIAQAEHRVEVTRATLTAAEQGLRRARELHATGGTARANLDAAEEHHQVAKSQHAAAVAALGLVTSGARPEERAAARAQVDAALADVQSARAARREIDLRRADADAARARLAQAVAAAARARAVLASTRVEAPFAGVVTRVWVEVGYLASPATPLLTLVDPDDLWIAADIADEDAAKVRVGQDVVVTAAAFPGRRFRARIVEIAPQAELKPDVAIRTRVVRVKARLLEGTNMLRPGLEVDVEGQTAVVASALVIPSDALVIRDTRAVVFVVENAVVKERQVRTGYTTFRDTEVLSGLNAGDLVVVSGKEGLRDDQRVRVSRGAGN